MSLFVPLTGSQLYQTMIEQYNADAAIPANTTTGSTLAAMFEASVLLALQLQQQLIYLFAVSRLETSSGPDVDTFVEPFGVFRNGPVFASGIETATWPSGPAQTILVGSQVQTENGVLYTVLPDPNNTTGDWNGSTGYLAVLTGGKYVATFIIQCNQDGIIGNANPNTITLPYGGNPPIPGSPVLTNPGAFTNAVGTESDDDLKTRFALYISGGGEGTVNATLAAALNSSENGGVTGLTLSFGDMVESVYTGGNWVFTSGTPGYFTIVADIAGAPGSITHGDPRLADITGSALLPNGPGIMWAYRPAGVSYNIIEAKIITVNVAGNLVIAPGYTASTVVAAAQAACIQYLNNIGLDQYGQPTTASLFGTGAIILGVPGVQDVTGLTLNGGSVDITAGFGSEIAAGDVTGLTIG